MFTITNANAGAHTNTELQAGFDEDEYTETLASAYSTVNLPPASSQRAVNGALKDLLKRLNQAQAQAYSQQDEAQVLELQYEKKRVELQRKILTDPALRAQLNQWLAAIANIAAHPFRTLPLKAPKFRFAPSRARIAGARACALALTAGAALVPATAPKAAEALNPKVLIHETVFLEGTHEVAAAPLIESEAGYFNNDVPEILKLKASKGPFLEHSGDPNRGLKEFFEANARTQFQIRTGSHDGWLASVDIEYDKETQVFHIHDLPAEPIHVIFGRSDPNRYITFDRRVVDIEKREHDRNIPARNIFTVKGGLVYQALDGTWYLHRLETPWSDWSRPHEYRFSFFSP